MENEEKQCYGNFAMTLDEDINKKSSSAQNCCSKEQLRCDDQIHDEHCIPIFRKKEYSFISYRIVQNVTVPVLCHLAVIFYVVLAIKYWLNQTQKTFKLYDGIGLLLSIVVTSYWSVFYYKCLKPWYATQLPVGHVDNNSDSSFIRSCFTFSQRTFSKIMYLIPISIFSYCLAQATLNDPQRLRSLLGLFLIITLGYFFSKHPTHIRWNIVFKGILVQIVMALCTVRSAVGREFLENVGQKIEKFLSYTNVGAAFVYSDYLVHQQTVFAFQALSVLFFVNFLVEILFYYAILQKVFKTLGGTLQKLMGTTIIESINCCVSVFFGMTEAMLVIKPYVADLTLSELQAVLLGQLSTVAGSLFAAYASFGVNPGYLVSASVMSAPAALSLSKLVYPETEISKLTAETFQIKNEHKNKYNSALSAGCEGAMSSVIIVTSMIATLIAFISLVAVGDGIAQWLAELIGYEDVTLVWLLGRALTPVAYVIGVDISQCGIVGELIATKMMINEFVAYQKLGKFKKSNLLSARSEAIATYALCSFSNPGSVASIIAMVSAVCPSQVQYATKMAFTAYIGGITTCLMTACIAGLLMPIDEIFF